ncbi:MAG: gamma-glutamyltranspeptidase [Caulobacteraceae bacterium]|nr:gamma-glutamyltranspeptidase [Caulobacteraceae bacterium]
MTKHDAQAASEKGLTRRSLAKLAVGGAALGGSGLAAAPSEAQTAPVLEPTRLENPGETLRPEIVGDFGIVAAGRHYTVSAATRMLLAGGNATDAGVAAVFAASVTEISHFGFGGEAPTILYDAKSGKVSVVNGQGTAPGLARPEVFAEAGIIPGNGPNGGTLPAMLDSMCRALQTHGTMSLHEVMQPAIEFADGFVMYKFLHQVFVSQQKATKKWGDWSYNTYYPGGHVPQTGEYFRQPNLAKTMRAIADADKATFAKTKDRVKAIQAGRDTFYKGDIARRIGAAVEKDGGLMRYEDLAGYQGRIEQPQTTKFYGYDVYKAGFWSQGPTQLMLLNILEAAGIQSMKPGSEIYLHTLAEALKLAFDDRNAYFGDPDFVQVPTEGLLSKAYAAERAKLIGPMASLEHRYGDPYLFDTKVKRKGPTFVPRVLKAKAGPTADTTSIQVVDRHGNLFSCTPSSGWLLGGAYVAGDTGVPLSNRMTVFDLDPSSPNVIAPHKRPRTTLSPAMVLKDGKPYLAIGTPGGDNQDQQICNVLLRVLAFDEPLQAAIEAPRINSNHFHDSFGAKRDAPGQLEIEDRVPKAIRDGLTARGHKLQVLGPFGVSTGIVAAGVVPGTGTLRGGADVRRERYAFGW